jgi:hypothetical protein
MIKKLKEPNKKNKFRSKRLDAKRKSESQKTSGVAPSKLGRAT